MVARGTNQILKRRDGVVWMEIATPTYRHAVTKFDEADLDKALDGGGRWRALLSGNRLYAYRNGPRPERAAQWLHREILSGVPLVDHKSKDSLDNRRENLRPATRKQNRQNSTSRIGSSSQYLGVHWLKTRCKWVARREGKYLGIFESEEAAARAYDADAMASGSPFVSLNFPS